MWDRAVSTAMLCLLAATPALCQETLPPSIDRPAEDALLPKAYVQVGLVASVHPEGTPYPRVYPTVHGISPGAMLSGGVRVSPTVALEVEAILERALITPLFLSGSFTGSAFDGEVRDVLFGANLRWKPSRKYRLECQVGGGVAVSRYS